MPWSPARRTQHRQAMARTAEVMKCPACERRSAVVYRRRMDWTIYSICRWTDEGKCTYSNEYVSRAANPTTRSGTRHAQGVRPLSDGNSVDALLGDTGTGLEHHVQIAR